MENISKLYADVQIKLLQVEKAAVSYEERAEQTPTDEQKLIQLFSQAFDAFCQLLAEYLKLHHKNFASGKSSKEIIENAHKAGFLAEHDSKKLLQAVREKDATSNSHKNVPPAAHPVKPHILNIEPSLAEIPLIHNIETYLETMQTIMREIKP